MSACFDEVQFSPAGSKECARRLDTELEAFHAAFVLADRQVELFSSPAEEERIPDPIGA